MEGRATTPHYSITTSTGAVAGQSALRTPGTHPGPPNPRQSSWNLPQSQGKGEVKLLTAIPVYLRRPESITLTNYLASEVFSKLLPGTPR